MAFGTFTLTAHFDGLEGTPAVGRVTIDGIPQVVIDPAGKKFKVGPKTVKLDASGNLSVALPSDSTTGNSTTIGFRVTVNLEHKNLDPIEFYARAIGSTIDLSDPNITASGGVVALTPTGVSQATFDAYKAANPGASDSVVTGYVNDSASQVRAALSSLYVRTLTPQAFGAKGDTRKITDAAVSGTTFTSATSPLTPADVGKTVIISNQQATAAQTAIDGAAFVTTVTAGLKLAAAPSFSRSGLVAWVGTNDSAALQACANAVPSTGGRIDLGPFKYLVPTGTITFPNQTKISGVAALNDKNAGGPSQIIFGPANSDAVVLSAAGCVLEDFTILSTSLYSTAPTAGTGLRVSRGFALALHRLGVVGFYDNVRVDEGYYYSISKCQIHDAAHYGMYFLTPDGEEFDHGDQIVEGTQITQLFSSRAGASAVRWESGGGLRFIGNKINGREQPANASAGTWSYGLDMMVRDGGTTTDLMCTGNSLENCTVALLRVGQMGTGTGSYGRLAITGNEFGFAGPGAVGVKMQGLAPAGRLTDYIISGNVFVGTLTNSVWAEQTFGLMVGPNVHTGVGGSTTSQASGQEIIHLGVGCRDCVVQDQEYRNADGLYLFYDDNANNTNDAAGWAGGRREWNTGVASSSTSTDTTVYRFAVPLYAGGVIDCSVMGDVNGVGAYMVRKSVTYFRNTGAVTTAAVGTDVTAGPAAPNVSVTFDTAAVSGEVQVKVRLAGTGGTAVAGRVRVFVDGPVVSVKKGA